jgi:hypothetical protein
MSKKLSKRTTAKPVTLKKFSKTQKQAIEAQYQRLKDSGKIKGTFQTYLNRSGQKYFDTFFKQFSKSAGKFSANTVLNIASGEYERYFIK